MSPPLGSLLEPLLPDYQGLALGPCHMFLIPVLFLLLLWQHCVDSICRMKAHSLSKRKALTKEGWGLSPHKRDDAADEDGLGGAGERRGADRPTMTNTLSHIYQDFIPWSGHRTAVLFQIKRL